MSQNSELRHWGLSLGEKSKNHKYVARVEDQIQVFLHNGRIQYLEEWR